MNPRGEFLQALFRILEQRDVPFCILRNYENVYADIRSDVDLVVESHQVHPLQGCLAEAAASTGHHLVLSVRYINFSFVYWHAAGGFLRVDVETEQRWSIFPVLSGKAIVGLRHNHGDFYVPHPRHESVVLFLAAIWRGLISDRYRTRLSQLYGEIKDPEELRRTFRASFGSAGDALADCQARILMDAPSPQILRDARNAIITNSFRNGVSRRALLHYLARDARRAGQRLCKPAGNFLLHASSLQPPRNLDKLLEGMENLYPAGKSDLHVRKLSSSDDPAARLPWGLKFARLRAIFKGGIFVLSFELSNDAQIPKLLKAQARQFYRSRTFVCVEGTRNDGVMGHAGSGFMDERESSHAPAFEHWVTRFIAAILRKDGSSTATQPKKGLFVVLLGLDGSGKTTVARKLCCLAGETDRFRAVRYYHWRLSLAGVPSFPLPSVENVPRKPGGRPYPLRSAVSALRLFKILLLTRLAWRWQTQKLLRDQTLVLMDRYYYNYYLDPVSVRYYGPAWLLEKVRPAYPKPDLIVVLKAPAATLLARKQELSELEIHRQDALLAELALDASHSLVVDASRPAEEVARTVMGKIISLRNA